MSGTAAVVGALRVDLGLETAEYSKGLDKAKAQLGSFVEGLKGFAEAAIAALALEKIADAIIGTVENMDKMGKAAQQVGMSVEDFTKFAYAAKLSDLAVEDMSNSFVKLAKNMDAAANGKNVNVAAAFQAVGVSMRDANGHIKTLAQALPEIADGFARSKDGVEKTAAAYLLFGKAGAQMIPLLDEGAKGFADAAAKAQDLGLVISGPAFEASKLLDEKWVELKATFEGFINQVLTPFLPKIAAVIAQFMDWVNATKVSEIAAKDLIVTLKVMATGFIIIGEAAAAAGQAIYHVFNAQAFAAAGNFSAAKDELVNTFDGIKDRVNQTKEAIAGLWNETNSIGVNRLPKLTMSDPGAIAAQMEASKAAATQTAAHQREIAKLIDSLKIQNEQFTKSALIMKIDEALRRAGSSATAAQRAEITALIIKHEQLTVAQQTAIQVSKNAEDQRKAMFDGLSQIADNSLNALNEWIDGTKSLGGALTDLLKQLAQAAVQAALLGKGSLAGMFGTDTSGGVIGGFLKGISGFSGLYAGGGQIPAGQWGFVGEGGGMEHAEVVAGPATVIPVSQMSGGTQINVNNYGSADGVGVSARKNRDGGINIDVVMTRKVNDAISSGQADGALGMRLGASPVRTRRG